MKVYLIRFKESAVYGYKDLQTSTHNNEPEALAKVVKLMTGETYEILNIVMLWFDNQFPTNPPKMKSVELEILKGKFRLSEIQEDK